MKLKKFLSAIVMVLYLVGLYFILDYMSGNAIFIMLAMLASIPFMVAAHELGHLIFGLLTGYKFVSYRIFSLTLVKEKGKLKFRKMSVPGTAGQCLMAPPRKKDGKYPYVLYNLGGVLFCGVLSLIPLTLGLFAPIPEPFAMMLYIFGFVSFFMNLINAIPTNGKGMANDGTNIRMAKRSPVAKAALWNQLEYISLHSQGIADADMPDELFFMPEKKELNNALTVWQGIAAVEKSMDMGNYAQAKDEVYYLLNEASVLMPLHKNVLQLEAIFLELATGGDADEIDRLYESVKKRISSLANSISTHRTLYAYYMLYKKDEAAAEKALQTFEKKAKKHPYTADVEFERKQIAHIDAIAQRNL